MSKESFRKCDVCEKRIERNEDFIKFKKGRPFHTNDFGSGWYPRLDMCESCYNDFISAIREKIKKENKC